MVLINRQTISKLTHNKVPQQKLSVFRPLDQQLPLHPACSHRSVLDRPPTLSVPTPSAEQTCGRTGKPPRDLRPLPALMSPRSQVKGHAREKVRGHRGHDPHSRARASHDTKPGSLQLARSEFPLNRAELVFLRGFDKEHRVSSTRPLRQFGCQCRRRFWVIGGLFSEAWIRHIGARPRQRPTKNSPFLRTASGGNRRDRPVRRYRPSFCRHFRREQTRFAGSRPPRQC